MRSAGLFETRRAVRKAPFGIMAAVVVPCMHEREQSGQPIGDLQLAQGKLADGWP